MLRPDGRSKESTYSLKVLGVNVALADATANLFLDVGMITREAVSRVSRGGGHDDDLLELIEPVDCIKVVGSVTLVASLLQMHQLGTGHTAPGNASQMEERTGVQMGFSPVLPAPAAMLVELDPGAKTNLALGDLGLVLLAYGVLAAGPVVGRDFWETLD